MKKPDRYFYPAVFSYADGEEIAVVFPDLDVATSGETQEDAFLTAWLNALALEHNINFSQTLQNALKQQLGL